MQRYAAFLFSRSSLQAIRCLLLLSFKAPSNRLPSSSLVQVFTQNIALNYLPLPPWISFTLIVNVQAIEIPTDKCGEGSNMSHDLGPNSPGAIIHTDLQPIGIKLVIQYVHPASCAFINSISLLYCMTMHPSTAFMFFKTSCI